MKIKNITAGLIIIQIIIFSAVICNAAIDYTCQGVDPNGIPVDDTCFPGLQNPVVRCSVIPLILNIDPDEYKDCKVKCAAACGGLTDCLSVAGLPCFDCCDTITCRDAKYTPLPLGIEQQEKDACMRSCEGTCEANTKFCDVITMLRQMAIIIAAIMIAINGIRWIFSEDMEARKDARRGLIYVVAGLTAIVLAAALVEFLLNDRIVCPL